MGSIGGRSETKATVPGDLCISIGNPGTSTPKGWSWKRLQDVARLESGHTPSRRKPEYWGGKVPWISTKDARANHGKIIYDTRENTNRLGLKNSAARILPKDTVCLSRTASVGYVLLMGEEMATSQDFANWVCGPELNPHYLRYALLGEHRALNMFAVGSVHKTIYMPELKAFHVMAPNRAEQDKIVSVLKGLDDKIELNRRVNATLEAQAQALFRDWFVDFGPTRAKMEGRAPYLPADLWSLFPDTLGGDGLPKGWQPGQLEDHCDLVKEKTDPADVEDDLPYIGLEHMPRGSIALTEWGTASDVDSRKSVFSEGDILFGKLRPYFHKVGLAPVDGICSTDILVLRPKNNASTLVMSCTSSKEFVDYATATSTGTKMPRANWQTLRSYPLPREQFGIVKAFEAHCSHMLHQIKQNTTESEHLGQTRNYLLPHLMSGEVKFAA